ncbi:tRNA splicing endonuclease subunit [Madurella fahalii]|uniref:tRNA splicing endonuclease subunit n=1 Tax=Madurella fahalii TaxID=1157608 RepID=A0ABQ0G5Z1_9PEZI
MGSTAEPIKAVDQPSSTEVSPSHVVGMVETKVEHAEDADTNGNHQNDNDSIEEPSNNNINGENEDNNEELTPPPDSPVEDTMSQASSVPVNALEDEIVVGTKTNNNNHNNNSSSNNSNKRLSPRATPDAEDVTMDDAEDKKPPESHQLKRKRVSGLYAESVGENEHSPAPTEEQEPRRVARPTKTHGTGGVKGVLLGFWRDSPPENDADKHGVIGFIDVRDRLRTRIQPTTRDGRPVDQRYPIPPGPGGSWVTFDKVAFDAHLVGQNHHVVKEFVKIRAENHRKDETPEETARLDQEAADLAAERVRTNPPPDAATAPLVAYGPEIPENAILPNRPENKKRRLAGSFGPPNDSPVPAQQHLDNIPGTRPTRILLGYWKLSSEPNPTDKHAVYGILGANDMFRVKLTRETRDGRPVVGNFPSGAGALWILWDEVEFDPHLKNLTRPEIKEYCRLRQRQLDLGEAPEDRVANETKAVYEAQQRVAQSVALGATIRKDDTDLTPIAMKGSPMTNGNGHDAAATTSSGTAPLAAKPDEPRQSRRLENNGLRARHSLPDVEFRAANRQAPGPGVLERTNSIARREIARLEAAQARADQRVAAAVREASVGPGGAATTTTTNNNNSFFQDNLSRLNKVWAAQEANRIKAGGEDAKVYMGVKYERKQNGPFEGKLVSQGTIISIDGEDYVEYRVLTKPTFF